MINPFSAEATFSSITLNEKPVSAITSCLRLNVLFKVTFAFTLSPSFIVIQSSCFTTLTVPISVGFLVSSLFPSPNCP